MSGGMIRTIASMAVTVFMCMCCVSPVSSAAPQEEKVVYVQEAKPAAAVKSSPVTNIKKTVKVKEDMVVKAGETLYVRSGGRLYIDEGVKLTVNGKLKVANGGEVYIKGSADINEGALTSISGKLKIMSAGNIDLSGELWVNPTGTVKGLGTLSVLNEFSDIICKGTVTAKIKAPQPVEKKGMTYVGGILLVNKKYALPESYGDGLDSAAYSAYVKMKSASGYDMSIVSGFRSYSKQQQTFAYWCSIDGEEVASTYSARPGHSEHQTGLAMDITSLNQSYGKTAEGKWLAANCYKYGFIIRYPKNKTNITGYMYEPWHIRYLGVSNAKLVHDSGLTLEEFLGVA